MSNAATASPEPPHPDPDRAVSAHLDSAGAGKILSLLHILFAYGRALVILFAYGRALVGTLRQERDPDDLPWYASLTSIFGTTNPALITVTIIRGLLRVTALRAKLSESVATSLHLPMQKDRAAKRIDGGRRPARGQPHATGWAIPPGWPAGDPSLDRQPTPEEAMFAEIVAEDRDRPHPRYLPRSRHRARPKVPLSNDHSLTIDYGPQASCIRRGRYPPWPAPSRNSQHPPAPAHPEPAA